MDAMTAQTSLSASGGNIGHSNVHHNAAPTTSSIDATFAHLTNVVNQARADVADLDRATAAETAALAALRQQRDALLVPAAEANAMIARYDADHARLRQQFSAQQAACEATRTEMLEAAKRKQLAGNELEATKRQSQEALQSARERYTACVKLLGEADRQRLVNVVWFAIASLLPCLPG